MEKHKEKHYSVFSNLEIRFEAPDDIEIALARGERAFIRFNAPSEGIGPGTDHVALTQEAALHLRFAKRASLDRVGQVRDFLTRAVRRPCRHPLRLRLPGRVRAREDADTSLDRAALRDPAQSRPAYPPLPSPGHALHAFRYEASCLLHALQTEARVEGGARSGPPASLHPVAGDHRDIAAPRAWL